MCLNGFPAQGGEVCCVETGKLTLFVAFNTDNHRLQDATFTAIDCHHGTARGGRKHNARIFFVLEERLSFNDAIAFLHQH